MRVFLLAAVLSFAASCTTTSAPEVAYYDNEQINIQAEVQPGAFDGLLKLYINEQVVIEQRSKAFGGTSQTFRGVWRGKPVTARATMVQNMLSNYTQIDVFIDGTLVETLTV